MKPALFKNTSGKKQKIATDEFFANSLRQGSEFEYRRKRVVGASPASFGDGLAKFGDETDRRPTLHSAPMTTNVKKSVCYAGSQRANPRDKDVHDSETLPPFRTSFRASTSEMKRSAHSIYDPNNQRELSAYGGSSAASAPSSAREGDSTGYVSDSASMARSMSLSTAGRESVTMAMSEVHPRFYSPTQAIRGNADFRSARASRASVHV